MEGVKRNGMKRKRGNSFFFFLRIIYKVKRRNETKVRREGTNKKESKRNILPGIVQGRKKGEDERRK